MAKWSVGSRQWSEGGDGSYARERGRMVEEQLQPRGIVMHRVLEAMREVPRHLFVGHEHSGRAYADEALPSAEGQTISQPYMVAVMTQELDVRRGDRVLEVGTGTGYQTAVLAHVVGDEGEVCTIEVAAGLAETARRRLEGMEVGNVRYFVGDGSAGWPEGGGFDRIMVTAGAPEIPEPLVGQLRVGGIMVAPIGRGETQTLMRIVRRGNGVEMTEVLGCRFVPLVGKYGWSGDEFKRGK